MIEFLLGVGLLYILPIIYQARTKFKEDKLTVSSSIISSFVVITGGYAFFGFYFYILNSIMNYFISLQLHGFIIFILGALLIVGGVFILMFTMIKFLGFTVGTTGYCHNIYNERRLEMGKSKMSTINIIRNKLVARAFAVIARGTPYVNTMGYFS